MIVWVFVGWLWHLALCVARDEPAVTFAGFRLLIAGCAHCGHCRWQHCAGLVDGPCTECACMQFRD